MVGSEKNAKEKLSLNLGLGDLMRPEPVPPTPQADPEIPAVSAVAESGTPSPALPPAAEPEIKNEFMILAEQGHWTELSTLAEQQPYSTREVRSIEAKLWWVRAQLESGGVPASILTAPLDSASRDLCEVIESEEGVSAGERARLSDLAAGILANAAARLGAPDRAMALTLLERAYRCDPEYRDDLYDLVVRELLESEAKPGRGHNKALDRKIEKLSELKQTLRGAGAGQPPVQPASDPAPAADREAPRIVPDLSDASSRLWSRSLTRSVAAVLIAALLIGGAFEYFNERRVSNAQADLQEVESAPALQNPSVQRIGAVNQLDALAYDMERTKLDPQQPVRPVIPPTGDLTDGLKGGAVSPGADNFAPPADVTKPPHRPARESVNTSYPLEGREMQKMEERAREGEERRDEKPEVKLFPDPPVKKSREPSSDYNGSGMYRIIAPTSVVSRPSYEGLVVDQLKAGDRIEVAARFGEWLRVISRNGNVGFVLSQDARPLDR